MNNDKMAQLAVNTIRTLSIDAVQAAMSRSAAVFGGQISLDEIPSDFRANGSSAHAKDVWFQCHRGTSSSTSRRNTGTAFCRLA